MAHLNSNEAAGWGPALRKCAGLVLDVARRRLGDYLLERGRQDGSWPRLLPAGSSAR